jgi:hypothetical protein
MSLELIKPANPESVIAISQNLGFACQIVFHLRQGQADNPFDDYVVKVTNDVGAYRLEACALGSVPGGL